MEDRHTVQSPLVAGVGTTGGIGSIGGSTYAAVFDGYGGGHSAEVSVNCCQCNFLLVSIVLCTKYIVIVNCIQCQFRLCHIRHHYI